MRQFAESYNKAVIVRFIDIEHDLKKEASISQPFVAQLLVVDNESFVITQQPVAQLEEVINNDSSLIVQRAVAQLMEIINIYLGAIVQRPVAQLEMVNCF